MTDEIASDDPRIRRIPEKRRGRPTREEAAARRAAGIAPVKPADAVRRAAFKAKAKAEAEKRAAAKAAKQPAGAPEAAADKSRPKGRPNRKIREITAPAEAEKREWGMSGVGSIVGEWRLHPGKMAWDLFGVNLDTWQDEVAEAFPHKQRIAMRACKNPGKTALLSILSWNYLLTRPHPKVLATSITGDNLKDGLWSEMAKWQKKAPLLDQKFGWTSTRIFAREHPETWFMSARTWPKTGSTEQQANTLAGIHSDYTLAMIDECGDIPPAVLIAAEAMLGSGKESHIVIAGNCTSMQGMLYEACVKNRGQWLVISVTGDPDDPRRSTRVSIEWARDLIARYGRTSAFVMVNVLGEFPSGNFNSLLSLDDCRAAQARNYRQADIDRFPRLIGVDVAFEGMDLSVMAKRQGPVLFPGKRWRNMEANVGAGLVSREWQDWDADACFVDSTGGYGAAWISHLKLLRRYPVGVNFSQRAKDETQFANIRAEMHWDFADWVKAGGMLPSDGVEGMPELIEAITQTTYFDNKGRIQIEPKELVKDKIGFSPDDLDAAILTFAQPVAERIRNVVQMPIRRSREVEEWSPMAALKADGYGFM